MISCVLLFVTLRQISLDESGINKVRGAGAGDANTFYIGKTIRHLATRVRNMALQIQIREFYSHLLTCETCKSNFSCNNFSVIDSGKNDFEVTIKEAFHIKFSEPIMNKQLLTQGSSFVLNVF